MPVWAWVLAGWFASGVVIAVAWGQIARTVRR